MLVHPLMLALGCSTTTQPAREVATLDVQLRVQLPDGMAPGGTLLAAALSAEEAEAGMTRDPARFTDLLDRLEVTRHADVVDGVVSVELALPGRPASAYVVYDGHGHGLEALMGRRPGVALAEVAVPAGAAAVDVALEGEPYRVGSDPCSGEREELVVLQADETKTPDDPGERRLCAWLPPSYASAPERRYPVVFVFPGLSGFHANSNGWRQRGLFDRVSEETGVEALVVGVGTRTPEGSSYLQGSERFGDWDRYVTERVVSEVDARFRTEPRRGTFGHSTGGWNALAAAVFHPEVFGVATASSPDAPVIDAWLLDGGAIRPEWAAWIRAEQRIGGRGQFASYGAAWSPDPEAPRGFLWPLDGDGVRPEVVERWREASLAADLATDAGKERAAKLSGRIAITAGRTDEFGLFPPAEAYVAALRDAGVQTEWLPTDSGHFGADEERMLPLVRFLLQHLGDAPPSGAR